MQSYDYSFITTIPKCYEFDFDVNNIDLSTTLYLDMVIGDLPIFEYCIVYISAIPLQTKTKWKGDEDCHSRIFKARRYARYIHKKLTLRRDRKLKDTFPWRIPGKCSLSI